MKKGINRHHAVRIIQWCKDRYGQSKYRDTYPDLVFTKKIEELGYYDWVDNLICVNSQNHEDLEDLASTIIEEWIHYTQSDELYDKYDEIYGYDNNPYEIEAKSIAKKDSKICIKELKRLHKYFFLVK